MKKLFCLAVVILALSACTQDVYEKGEGPYSRMLAEMVVAHANSDKQIDYVVTDENERLVTAPPFTTSWITTADSTYRGILYYNKGDKQAEAISFNRVTVLAPQQIKDVKTDPVKVETCWVSTNQTYLNLGVRLMVGSTTDTDAKQLVAAHLVGKKQNIDGTKTVFLQFYHDQNGVPAYYSHRSYFSIPLSGLNADSVSISINTYEGTTTHVFPMN
ncbi:MAG: hypothetical protein K6D91_07470 [Prevotella sp.]|nr:hypothetical protein [Prevotella sp.]